MIDKFVFEKWRNLGNRNRTAPFPLDFEPRCTSEQVAAEKEQKLQEKLGKVQKKEDAIKNAAHLEDTMDNSVWKSGYVTGKRP